MNVGFLNEDGLSVGRGASFDFSDLKGWNVQIDKMIFRVLAKVSLELDTKALLQSDSIFWAMQSKYVPIDLSRSP